MTGKITMGLLQKHYKENVIEKVKSKSKSKKVKVKKVKVKKVKVKK